MAFELGGHSPPHFIATYLLCDIGQACQPLWASLSASVKIITTSHRVTIRLHVLIHIQQAHGNIRCLLSSWLELSLLSKLRPRDLSMVVTVPNSRVFWFLTRGVLVRFWGPVVVPPYPRGAHGLQIAGTMPCSHCVLSCTDMSFHLEEVLPASLWHMRIASGATPVLWGRY